MKKLSFLLLSLGACGPLFNHGKRAAQNDAAPMAATSDARATDCPIEFTKLSWCAHLKWEVKANDSEDSVFNVGFWPKEGGNSHTGPFVAPPHEFFAELWMKNEHMDHGSVPTKIETLPDGRFRVSNVYFIMPGTWQLRLQLRSNGAVVDQHVMRVDI